MNGNHKFDRSLLTGNPDLSFEQALWSQQIECIGGVDEAGRGALAGPVSAAIVILPCDPGIAAALYGVNDSKQMTPKTREFWAEQIKRMAFSYGIGFASSQEIDQGGIVPAIRLAIGRALDELCKTPQHLLVDYLNLPEMVIPQTALVKGDARSLSIAAASVLAKTARDELMREMDRDYPVYYLGQNKGYGTRAHREAIHKHGLSPIHRATFTLHDQ